MEKRAFFLAWFLPLLAFLLIAPFTPYFDLVTSKYFYTPATTTTKAHFVSNGITHFLFAYGERLGFLVAGAALGLFLLSWKVAALRKWRKPMALMILTWGIGCGLLINTIFKQVWGRARPRATTEFMGKEPFRPFYKPNWLPETSQKSFPSGHTATGFFFFSLVLIVRRHGNKTLFFCTLTATLAWGISLALCRIAQGGHFLSDTLASALIMWLTALFIDYWLYERKTKIITPNN